MSPDELQRRFEKLRAARDSGTLDEAQFHAAVAGLRLQGTDGTWYQVDPCLLYTSPSPRDGLLSRMPSSA